MSREKNELRVCWLCGRNGSADPLDKHHIFGGAFRGKSEKLGLTVDLCHHDCHIFGPEAVHRNRATMQRLQEYGQRLAMDRFGWSEEDFRREFGKSYIQDEATRPAAQQRNDSAADLAEDARPDEAESVAVFGFTLLPEDAALPYN